MTTSTPRQRLAALIADGMSPGDATGEILQELPPAWRSWVHGFVYREAMSMESRQSNQALKAALSPSSLPGIPGTGQGKGSQATARLRQVVYHTARGQRVLWGDMTLDLIRHKIALFRKNTGGLIDHLGVLTAAESLLLQTGAATLGDVPDWPERIRAFRAAGDIRDWEERAQAVLGELPPADASGQVASLPPGAARPQETGSNATTA